MDYINNPINKYELLDDVYSRFTDFLDEAPIFDPTKAEIMEIEVSYIKDNGIEDKKVVEAINAEELPGLDYLDDTFTEKGNITCWEHGNFDRLHIFSNDLQKRSTIHIEYTYVVNMGTGEKKFKSAQNLTKYLEICGI